MVSHGVGEPLINPAFLDIVEFVKRYGAQAQFNTNATKLSNALSERFIDLGVDTITYSIDGATRETYETIRRGARFGQVLDNMRGMRDLKRRRRSMRPHTSFAMVVMADNVHEAQQMVELAADLDVEHVHFEPLLWQNDPDGYGRFYEQQTLGQLPSQAVADHLGEARKRARELGIGVSSQLFDAEETFDYPEHVALNDEDEEAGASPQGEARDTELICTEPWTTLFVTWDGAVRTCCGSMHSFGDLDAMSIADIWNGQAYHAVRKSLSDGAVPEMCTNCVRNGRMRHAIPQLREILDY